MINRVFSTLRLAFAASLMTIVMACAAVDSAERTETLTRTLTVRDIDRDARRLTVTGDGQRFVLRASEDVRNFDQIAVGDRVNIEYVESIALQMAAPGDPGTAVAVGGAAVAAEGQKPGVAAGSAISGVVQFLNYDRVKQTVLFRTQSGDIFATSVAPELRSFAASRQAGDFVAVTYATGIAVGVTPA